MNSPILATICNSQNLSLPHVAEVVLPPLETPPLETPNVALKPDQMEHATKLLAILSEHARAIDSSTTGSGKTYVGGYIARTLLQEGRIDNVHIICPPSLIQNWKNVLGLWGVPITFIHGYNKGHYPQAEKCLLILDEFHFLKNTSQRYYRARKLATESLFIHATSATPIDNSHQHSHLAAMFGIDISLIQCRLVFKPPVEQAIQFLTEREKVDEHIEDYRDGYRKISMSGRLRQQRNGGPPRFNGKLYTKGLHMIHLSMYDHLVSLIKEELKQPNRKVIVIEHFKDIVTKLTEELGEYFPLLLNGSTRQNDRDVIVSKFQESNNDRRLLITSAVVGGVGLSLDDQNGGFPRTTIVMPLGNYIDYKQTLGRTYRRNTKSNSKVVIAQPYEEIKGTYMLSIITNKGGALDEYLDKAQ